MYWLLRSRPGSAFLVSMIDHLFPHRNIQCSLQFISELCSDIPCSRFLQNQEPKRKWERKSKSRTEGSGGRRNFCQKWFEQRNRRLRTNGNQSHLQTGIAECNWSGEWPDQLNVEKSQCLSERIQWNRNSKPSRREISDIKNLRASDRSPGWYSSCQRVTSILDMK
jgi:hypothetical protein